MAEKTIKNNESNTTREGLIIGIDNGGKIIQFNRKCIKTTGYQRHEALEKNILQLLVPTQYHNEWQKMVDSARKNENQRDVIIPWINNSGQEILISWNTLPVKNEDGVISDVCFIGKNLGFGENNKEQVIQVHENRRIIKIEQNQRQQRKSDTEKSNEKKTNKSTVKSKKEKIFNDAAEIKKKTQNQETNRKKGKLKIKINKDFSNKNKKPNVEEEINDSYGHLLKKYDQLFERLIQLEKKDKKLERKNKRLEKSLNKVMKHLPENNDFSSENLKPDRSDIKGESSNNQYGSKRQLTDFFKDPFGKKQKNELAKTVSELEHRKKVLDTIETKLMQDKKAINLKMIEFSKWKEKLTCLEEEIERRNKEILDKEKTLEEQISNENPVEIKEPKVKEYHDLIDKIPQSAVIIQRGKLKQINDSFAELMGYSNDEIINKNLLELIASQGLEEVKKYYLDRLKGNDSSSFETVFSTKNNEKIYVEITTKPTMFNGDQADLAIIKEIEVKTDSLENENNINSEREG